MDPISRVCRAFVITACVAATSTGVALVAMPRWAGEVAGTTPAPIHAATAFGVALLLGVAAFLLRSHRRPSVEYHAVRFEARDEIRRPAPARLRPKVGEKVRKRVRDGAAARVEEVSRRRRD